MATDRTVKRNTGVFTQAQAQGKRVRFTYTDSSGVVSKRTVKPVGAKATRHNQHAALVEAQDGLNFRTFRTDRVLRARIVG